MDSVQILNTGETRPPQDPATGAVYMGGEVPLYYRTLQKSQEIQGRNSGTARKFPAWD
jgi:hypothetical protein